MKDEFCVACDVALSHRYGALMDGSLLDTPHTCGMLATARDGYRVSCLSLAETAAFAIPAGEACTFLPLDLTAGRVQLLPSGAQPRHIPNLRVLIDRELEALAADPASDFAEAAAYILLLRREIGAMVAGQRQLLNPREREQVAVANETEEL